MREFGPSRRDRLHGDATNMQLHTLLNVTRWEAVLPARQRAPDFCPQRKTAGALFLRQALDTVASHRSTSCSTGVRSLGVRPNRRMKDGGKNVCPDTLDSGRCIVYSLGSRGDFSFEQDVVRQFNCSVFTFDCTVTAAAVARRLPAGVQFKPLCIGEPKQLVQGRGTAAPAGVGAGSFVSLGHVQRQVRREAPSFTRFCWTTHQPIQAPSHVARAPHAPLLLCSSVTRNSICSRWTLKALSLM